MTKKPAAKKTTNRSTKPETILVLRTCAADMTSHNGTFRWPESGPVECLDWVDDYNCGHGLHGLPWGEGEGSVLDWSLGAKWLVVEVAATDVRYGQGELVGKCKFPRGVVVFCGDRFGATSFLSERALGRKIVGAVVTVGARGTATVGDDGTATAGDDGTIIIRWWDGRRYRVAVGYVGANEACKPGIKYRCDATGALVEVTP